MPPNLAAMRLTKRYKAFLPEGAVIINYAEKASGRDCDLCGHTPETRPPKPGYPTVSEEMRVMRVQLPEGTKAEDIKMGRTDFTVTGTLIELNVCVAVADCRARCAELTNSDGSPKYEPTALQKLRAG